MWFVNAKLWKFKDFLLRTILLSVGFWPGAEDRALRGRNLSAVFRTLYRQVGKPFNRLPSCAHTWRVENPCGKSNRPNEQRLPSAQKSSTIEVIISIHILRPG